MSDFDSARAALTSLRSLGRRTRYDERNRLALLAVHVAGGLTFSACFAHFGIPQPWVSAYGLTWVPDLLVTATPAVGAALLAVGLAWHRQVALEAAGMGVLLAWELAGMVAVLRWIDLEHPGAVQYHLVFYGLPAALMIVHLVTLVAYLRTRGQS